MYIKSPINSFFQLNQLKRYLKDIDGAFISGGCFKNIFKNEPVKDIDIFFFNQQYFEDAVDEYEYNTKYSKLFENDNCIAFKHKKNHTQVELIRSIFGTPEEIMNNFDFTIVKACLLKSTQLPIYPSSTQSVIINSPLTIPIDLFEELRSIPPAIDFIEEEANINEESWDFIYHDKFFEHLLLNKLVIDNQIPKSVATFNRALKYAGYGYGLCRESKVKLANAIIQTGDVEDINNDLYFGWD